MTIQKSRVDSLIINHLRKQHLFQIIFQVSLSDMSYCGLVIMKSTTQFIGMCFIN